MGADAQSAIVRITYQKIRDVTTPEEAESGASTHIIVIPAFEILKIGTEGNLRSYIPAHPGKKRSAVHRAIGRTIRDNPMRFSQLNSGFLIGASRIEVDDKNKTVTLYDPSVNNGAQSQGEIALYRDDCRELGAEPNSFFVRAEISVEPDESFRTEIAIARNDMTKVKDLSQAGKRRYFDEIDEGFRRVFPGKKLAKSETELSEDFVDTRLLLQVLWALIPDSLVPERRMSIEGRMRAYKNAASCLADFQRVHDEKDDPDKPDQAARFQYFVDMAGEGYALYEKWATHSEWQGRRLHEDAGQITRSEKGDRVADGLVFPIVAAHSNFVSFDGSMRRWKIRVPQVFRDADMAEAARGQLKECQGRPFQMGRSGQAYQALMLLTKMAVRYAATDR